MPGSLDEALAFGTRPRRETMCIFTDDAVERTCVMNSSRSTRNTREKSLPEIPVYKMFKSPRPRSIQQRTPMRAPTRKAPLQKSVKPPQPGASVYDIPGSGGGKENIPPGMSVCANTKSKPIGVPVRQIIRRAESNPAPTKDSRSKHTYMEKESSTRMSMSQAGNASCKVPKPGCTVTLSIQAPMASPRAHQSFPNSHIANIVVEVIRAYWMLVGNIDQKRHPSQSLSIARSKTTPPKSNSCTEYIVPDRNTISSREYSASERDKSVVIIQRAWRSCIERKQNHECAIAQAKIERAAEVITRWWRGVKPSRKPEKTPRRKVAAQRSTTRQSRGRLGLRRL